MAWYNRCYSTGEMLDLIAYEEKYSAPLRHINLVLTLVTCIAGLIGNAIVILFNIFVMQEHKAKIWFLNLAITDFVALLLLPLQAFSILKNYWPYGKLMCKMFLIVTFVNMYANIFILIALNLSRVLSVVKPIFYRQFISQRVSRWTCIMIWVMTILASIPVLLYSGEFKDGDDNYCSLNYFKDFDEEASNPTYNLTESVTVNKMAYLNVYEMFQYFFKVCSPEECCSDEDTFVTWNKIIHSMQSFSIPLLLIGYLLPFFVIIFSNITIVIQVRKSPTVNSHRLYQTVIIISILHFVTSTPLMVGEMILLAAVRNMDLGFLIKIMTFMPLLCTIAYTNCSLNPIMYVLVGRQARASLADFLSSICTRSS